MTIFQLLAVLFALFMAYVTFVHFKKNALTDAEASFWFSTWGFFVIMALFPELLVDIAGILHFSRVFDLLVVGAFMIITVMVFSIYFKQKQLQHKLERMVKEAALAQPLFGKQLARRSVKA